MYSPVVEKKRTAASKVAYAAVKRLFDVVVCILALPLFGALFLVIGALIKMLDGGAILYRAERMGKDGQPFLLYKFKTMEENADQILEQLPPEMLQEYKTEFKLRNDPRVTKLGRMLRRSSLDELPQLVNILKNDMSLIGPRPVLDRETRLYGNNRALLLSVKPGLTGYWQAYARNDVGYANGKRQAMELYYVENCSPWLDLRILFATVGRVIGGKGAH